MTESSSAEGERWKSLGFRMISPRRRKAKGDHPEENATTIVASAQAAEIETEAIAIEETVVGVIGTEVVRVDRSDAQAFRRKS